MLHTPSHPLIRHLVNTLRDNSIPPQTFRHTIAELTRLLAYEGLRELPTVPKMVPTWQGERSWEYVDDSNIMVVSVLRAALPMHQAMLELLPGAVSGFLGMKRDETTHEAVLYYDRTGDCAGKTVILVDPMVATGGSLCDALKVLIDKGAESIVSLNIIGSSEGVETVRRAYPEVTMVVAQIDPALSDDKFILPGLGDAGDRAYNTL